MSTKKPASKKTETAKTPANEGVDSSQALRKKTFINKRAENLSKYIFKVLKQLYPDFDTADKYMKIMHQTVADIFEKVAQDGVRLIDGNEIKKFKSSEIKEAVNYMIGVKK